MDKTFKVFNTDVEITWCPGCGDYSILMALKEAMFQLGLKTSNSVIVSGIGQAAKTPQYVHANGFNSLHGRALPPALGIHSANKDLNIFVTSGDGDTYGEGGNHFIHNIRRNPNMVHLVYNNRVYGLTKGQGSPTTDMGRKTTMQTDGTYMPALNPMTLAMTMGAGFVARAYAGDRDQLVALIKEAHKYQGYALIDIMQPCPSFNKVNTAKWYKEKTYYLDDTHDSSDFEQAYKAGLDVTEHIALGILYKSDRVAYLDAVPQYKDSLVKRKWQPTDAQVLLEDFE